MRCLPADFLASNKLLELAAACGNSPGAGNSRIQPDRFRCDASGHNGSSYNSPNNNSSNNNSSNDKVAIWK